MVDTRSQIGIFIFRRDLRLIDNLALYQLSKKCSKIIPIFILDPYQIDRTKNNKYYYSNNAVQFMCESLIDLYNQLNCKLILIYDNPISVVNKIIHQLKTEYESISIGFNRDFTEYAIKRDDAIINLCEREDIDLVLEYHDHTLLPYDNMIKKDNSAYLIFSPFYKNARKIEPDKPIQFNYRKYDTYKFKNIAIISINELSSFYTENNDLAERGGRINALKHMNAWHIYKEYEQHRDQLSFNTYRISAYLNFGCLSIREFYQVVQSNETIYRQLYWRDFYNCILRYTPNATSYNKSLNPVYDTIKWINNREEWNLLIQAKTGYLIIDAAMRELVKTGYIGNRARMLLAIFWTKYLLIHPLHNKYGAQVGFSKYLLDCSTSQNKLNHQWILELDKYQYSSKHYKLSGRPFRVDNEMIKKYDKDCVYIKKWLPEFKDISNTDIYHWSKDLHKKYRIHVSPIFNWKDRYNKWRAITKI